MNAHSHTEVEMSASCRQQKVLLFYITHSPKQQKSNWPLQSSLTVTQKTEKEPKRDRERALERERRCVGGRVGEKRGMRQG